MRIGIVNDMPLAIEVLRLVISREHAHQVIWTATDGLEALQKCEEQRPDVVLMDMLMPRMNGVEATRRIMAECPCAILIVTSDIERNMNKVFEAMGHGALDVVNTPSLIDPQAVDATALLRKLHNIGWMIGQHGVKSAAVHTQAETTRKRERIVAIGASAGGPASLVTLLRQLPADFSAGVVLVQHVDEVFAKSMAQWLATESKLPVRLAQPDDQPRRGEILLAGTNNHLCMQANGRLCYRKEPAEQIYRPSIDVFFDSLVRHWQGEAVGVLLTGMGRDGAQGLKNMRERGFLTIAQDQATCAVYGMPKAAASINAAVEILPLDQIASKLIEHYG
ncbi:MULTISPECIES: chemotaxis response regulator protein-glutamate methylesterase [Pseudomonas]|uniref:Protein-glutamate methylesterase/protein-glutamine glutaminase n=1 Tax=Pseudomonas segetis TaxID=298908 RepID=A0A238ZJ78_9PSED|nr:MULTISPECIES: chemotaxis response regulator protein-glutamate methylesterase [Pseudomonas]SNR83526.1 two-component system, chemotaxis family, response regulator WspF [Pseudomonas segetis]